MPLCFDLFLLFTTGTTFGNNFSIEYASKSRQTSTQSHSAERTIHRASLKCIALKREVNRQFYVQSRPASLRCHSNFSSCRSWISGTKRSICKVLVIFRQRRSEISTC